MNQVLICGVSVLEDGFVVFGADRAGLCRTMSPWQSHPERLGYVILAHESPKFPDI